MNQYTKKNQQPAIAPGTRVLFANFPADGHFNPLTGLAVHLKEAGCDVRWYTSPAYAEKIGRMDIPFYGFKKALDVNPSVDLESIFPERKKHRSQVGKLKFDMIHAFIRRSPEYYADILNIYQEFPFEIMVADITFGAIPFVKDKMNIPVIGVSIVPLPETSRDLPPAGLGLTPSSSLAGRWKQHLLRFIADQVLFAKPTRVMRQLFGEYGIDAGKANIFDILIRKSTVVLQSGTPGFEYARTDMSPHIFFAGPLLPYASPKTSAKWTHEKLNRYQNVVLVTQGTVEKDTSKLIIPTLEAFRNSNCLVIVTTGGSQTAQLKEAYPDDNFIIEDFIPFADVLPYTDVYVTNGGYGGVLLSIGQGVPMVVAGVHEGKNEINARVAYFELGINLKTEKPTPQQVARAVDTILSTEKYALNVNRLRQEFNLYQPGAVITRHVARLLRQHAQHKRTLQEETEFIY